MLAALGGVGTFLVEAAPDVVGLASQRNEDTVPRSDLEDGVRPVLPASCYARELGPEPKAVDAQ